MSKKSPPLEFVVKITTLGRVRATGPNEAEWGQQGLMRPSEGNRA